MRKLTNFDRTTINEVAIALVLWNAKKVSVTKTLMKIKKLLKPEFHQYWKAYDKGLLTWSKKLGLVKKLHKKT